MRASLPALDATEGPQDAAKVLRGHEIRIADGGLMCLWTIDRCSPRRAGSGSAADVVWFGTFAAVILGTRTPTHWSTATTHNARHQRAPDSQCLFASVPKVRGFSS